MLGKLLKHDFKSLLRRIWPAFPILLASAGLCRLFMWLGGRYPAFSLVRGISLMLFVLLLVAGYVFVYVVCVMRFYQSMLMSAKRLRDSSASLLLLKSMRSV